MAFLVTPNFSKFVQSASPNSIETVGHFALKAKLPNAGIGEYCARSGNGMCVGGRSVAGLYGRGYKGSLGDTTLFSSYRQRGVYPVGGGYRSPGLGDLSTFTTPLGIAGIAIGGLFLYQLLFGYAAKTRRKQLSAAKSEYMARVRTIRRKYPRHSFYARAGE